MYYKFDIYLVIRIFTPLLYYDLRNLIIPFHQSFQYLIKLFRVNTVFIFHTFKIVVLDNLENLDVINITMSTNFTLTIKEEKVKSNKHFGIFLSHKLDFVHHIHGIGKI